MELGKASRTDSGVEMSRSDIFSDTLPQQTCGPYSIDYAHSTVDELTYLSAGERKDETLSTMNVPHGDLTEYDSNLLQKPVGSHLLYCHVSTILKLIQCWEFSKRHFLSPSLQSVIAYTVLCQRLKE